MSHSAGLTVNEGCMYRASMTTELSFFLCCAFCMIIRFRSALFLFVQMRPLQLLLLFPPWHRKKSFMEGAEMRAPPRVGLGAPSDHLPASSFGDAASQGLEILERARDEALRSLPLRCSLTHRACELLE